MWRWIIGGAVTLLLAFGFAAVVGGDSGPGDGRWNHDGVERVVSADGTETLIIHDDRGGFPFGIIVIPLVVFGLIALARGVFGRGRGGGPAGWGAPGGPGGWGYGPPWAYGAYGGPTGHGSTGPGNNPGPASQVPAAPPWFEEWHRRAHDAQPSQTQAAAEPPITPPAAPTAPRVD